MSIAREGRKKGGREGQRERGREGSMLQEREGERENACKRERERERLAHVSVQRAHWPVLVLVRSAMVVVMSATFSTSSCSLFTLASCSDREMCCSSIS